jgi:hypothetical protein
MRQHDNNICFYEPFHPKLNTLAEGSHSSELGHSVKTSPWAEHQHFRESSAYFRYADTLPQYIVENMGYHHPFHLSRAVEEYFLSLEQLALQQSKCIVACFNRSAFVAHFAESLLASCKLFYVHTRRPAMQIVMSLAKIYARSKDFNLFSREYRDPWGITLLFDQYYGLNCKVNGHNAPPSSSYSFVVKACYMIRIVDLFMQKLSPLIFDISEPAESYIRSAEALFCKLECQSLPKGVRAYIRSTYKQDPLRLSLPASLLTRYEKLLLESVDFREFS